MLANARHFTSNKADQYTLMERSNIHQVCKLPLHVTLIEQSDIDDGLDSICS